MMESALKVRLLPTGAMLVMYIQTLRNPQTNVPVHVALHV